MNQPKLRERSISSVPIPALTLLGLGLIAQVLWHAARPEPQAQAQELPVPPAFEYLHLLSLGDPEALSKLLMLWLQTFDNQPGVSIPFRKLDYPRVIGWLERILELDPQGQYPLLAASRLYGEVPDKAKQRQMLEFVYKQFFYDPNRRWPWLTHAVYIAKHRLHDLPLALRYAQAISAYATGKEVPHWAQQMQIFVLEDMGETESARVLIGGLLEGGTITDPHELRFLLSRLNKLKDLEVNPSRR
jgi:hypothetical protein